MHIISFALLAVAGAAAWYWRLRILGQAGAELIGTAQTVRGHIRRRRFRAKAEGATLNAIEHPGIAAAVLLHRLADENPESRARADGFIRRRLAEILPASELDEIMIHAAWVAGQVIDPREPVRRFRDLWRQRLTSEERGELVAMATEVAAAGGTPTHEQSLVLTALRRNLGV